MQLSHYRVVEQSVEAEVGPIVVCCLLERDRHGMFLDELLENAAKGP